MTPHEKAVNALNRRLERLQANLRDAKSEATQQFLFQSLVVTLGLSEGLSDYIKAVGEHARRRHGTFKESSAGVGARHSDLLNSGKELLDRLKANPADRTLRKELERAQRNMELIQKNLRREAFAVQRELSLSTAMIDRLADAVRRLCEADQAAGLKRAIKALVGHVRELYGALKANLPATALIDPVSWENSAATAIDQATDFHDAYARAGHQALLALEVMTLAVSNPPPQTAEEATQRANEAVAARVKEITRRFTAT